MAEPTIKTLKNKDEITSAFNAFVELRPHIKTLDQFISQVLEQQRQGYEIIGIIDSGEVAACAGFRITNMLAWGKILYLDDLITREKFRGKGYGKLLLQNIIKTAEKNHCDQVHLDTGYTRHDAHKVYLNQGFKFDCHHLSLSLR